MPVILRTGTSTNITSSMRYVSTGQYNIGRRINKPKITAQKSVKYRNYLMEGVNNSGIISPKMSKRDQLAQYKLGLQNNRYWLNQDKVKDESVNLVMSFGHELDWRKPNDLMCGRWIVNRFCHLAYPHQSIWTGYQMDNANRQSHVHLIVNTINHNSIKSFTPNSHFSNYRLYKYEEQATKEWNTLHPDKHIKPYSQVEHEPNHLNRIQKLVLNKAKKIIPKVKSNYTNFYQMHQLAKRNGLVMMGFKHGNRLDTNQLKNNKLVDGYLLRLPKNKNYRLQNKPQILNGRIINRYIRDARATDIRRALNQNNQHPILKALVSEASMTLQSAHNYQTNSTSPNNDFTYSYIPSSVSSFITSANNDSALDRQITNSTSNFISNNLAYLNNSIKTSIEEAQEYKNSQKASQSAPNQSNATNLIIPDSYSSYLAYQKRISQSNSVAHLVKSNPLIKTYLNNHINQISNKAQSMLSNKNNNVSNVSNAVYQINQSLVNNQDEIGTADKNEFKVFSNEAMKEQYKDAMSSESEALSQSLKASQSISNTQPSLAQHTSIGSASLAFTDMSNYSKASIALSQSSATSSSSNTIAHDDGFQI